MVFVLAWKKILNMLNDLRTHLAPYALRKPVSHLVRPLLKRPTVRHAGRMAHVYYEPNRISFSQIYPLFFHAAAIHERHDVALRAFPVSEALAGHSHGGADIIIFQPWFTTDPDRLKATLARLRQQNPEATIAFFDSFAHNDLRLGRHVDPLIDLYVKKSLFRDRSLYQVPRRGDTNLTEYYGDLYGIDQPLVDWETPEAILPKLRTGANFLTAPQFASPLVKTPRLEHTPKIHDIHARMATKGSPWYQAMREAALSAVKSSGAGRILTEGSVPWAEYMREMRAARLCFSPFGYGEICWRDIEAFMTGSVLLKPDMSHLETRPDLYVAGETYLPVKWDFSDLGDVARKALADSERCVAIAETAYERMHIYIAKAGFADHMHYLFTAKQMPQAGNCRDGKAYAKDAPK